MLIFIIFSYFFASACSHLKMKLTEDSYLIGAGIADITGPAAEVNMMGYAKLGQDTSGIHIRLYSRAFIFEDTNGKRVCFISADLGMIDQAIKTQVITMLQSQYHGIYDEKNVMISGTHTHSGPGGFLQYLLYIITAQGFNWQSFNAILEGIVKSVVRAHENVRTGFIYYNKGILLNASINRSPSAYTNNSEEERKQYKYDTDKEMHVLKLVDSEHEPIGMISWFAVHPTSMNNTNTLISGDNKGVASLLFEKFMNNGSLPGKGPFVAAFANANLGDVSPNIKGPHCLDTGLPCSISTSTCDGTNSNCIAFGPGKDMFESTKIIGERQFLKAKELFESATEQISGDIDFVHQHIDMSKIQVLLPDGRKVRTCKPAMGYSFAAGTIDGAGAFDFKQGSTSDNRFWNLIRDFISKPSKEMIECHKPKPILVSTGQMTFPYQWQPTILPTQIFKIGNIVIGGLPAEFTTMAGRRIKAAIKNVFAKNDHMSNLVDNSQ
jgi:neutral ceramidase